MISVSGAFIILTGLFNGVVLKPDNSVTIASVNITVADIVEPTSLPSDFLDNIADKVIATIPAHQSSVMISRTDLANLLRRRVPALSGFQDASGSEMVTFKHRDAETQRSQLQCQKTIQPIRTGEPLLQTHLELAGCISATEPNSLHYDKLTGVLRATKPIAADTNLGRIRVPEKKFVDTGNQLVLKIVVGSVVIERDVWALQPAHKADYIFVRDQEHDILRVPVATHRAEVRK